MTLGVCRQIKSLASRRNERRDEKGLKVLHFYQRDIILKKSFTLDSVHLSTFDTDSFVILLLQEEHKMSHLNFQAPKWPQLS